MKKITIIFSFIAFLTNLYAIEVGETKAAVLSELGQPQSHIQSSSREILNYEMRTIQLKDGIVQNISYRPVKVAKAEKKEEAQPSTPEIVEQRMQTYRAYPYSGIVVVPRIELHPQYAAK